MDYWWGVFVGIVASYVLGSAVTIYQMSRHMMRPVDYEDWSGLVLAILFWPLVPSYLLHCLDELESKRQKEGDVRAARPHH